MAVTLASLWLPIVLSAVAAFIASMIVCVVLPLHRNDWKKFPNEDAFVDAVRAQKLPDGQYMYPSCTPADMKDPAKKARFDQGPWVLLRIAGGSFNMGKTLGLWFAHLLIVALFVAYVAHLALGAKEPTMHVFRLTSAVALIAYCGGALPSAAWEGKPMDVALKSILDGLVYALITGGIFGWLWPHGA